MSLSYQSVAVISYKVMDAIVERLQWMKAPNETILCVGKEALFMQTILKKHYQEALFLDESIAEPQSADWVIAHFGLPYTDDPLTLLWQWRAFLKPGGMLFCTHFGPDTLVEWQAISHHILPSRMDMHILGDLLMHAGLSDPVVDVDYLYTRHRVLNNYLQELTLTHMIKETTKPEDVNNEKNEWITTYEIVFAHAFCEENDADARTQDDTGLIVKVPVSKIKRISKSKEEESENDRSSNSVI